MTDPSDWFAAQHYFVKGACESFSPVSAPPEDLVAVRRGLFRRERRSPKSLEEYRELFRSNSVEATIASWEETARSVLRDAGLPDHLNNVILEPGGSWREITRTGDKPTREQAWRMCRDLAEAGEQIISCAGLIQLRELELTPEDMAERILRQADCLRGCLARGDAELAAWHAMGMQRAVDMAAAMNHWQQPVERTWRRVEANRQSSERAHGSPAERAEKQVKRVSAFDQFRAQGYGIEQAKQRAAQFCGCCERTIERALKKRT